MHAWPMGFKSAWGSIFSFCSFVKCKGGQRLLNQTPILRKNGKNHQREDANCSLLCQSYIEASQGNLSAAMASNTALTPQEPAGQLW